MEDDENVKIFSSADVSAYAIGQQQAALNQAPAKVQPSNPQKRTLLEADPLISLQLNLILVRGIKNDFIKKISNENFMYI